jgi:hypothetical protein
MKGIQSLMESTFNVMPALLPVLLPMLLLPYTSERVLLHRLFAPFGINIFVARNI